MLDLELEIGLNRAETLEKQTHEVIHVLSQPVVLLEFVARQWW